MTAAELQLRGLRSPSTSTISSASERSWTDASLAEPRQRALVKVPSLPVPTSPTDAAPLPHRRTARIPRAQVFVARPSTPRSLAGFAEERARLLDAVRDARRKRVSPVAQRPRSPSPQRGLGARCVSDVARFASPAPTARRAPPPLRRASSVGNAGRVCTPAPTFWAAAAEFECANVFDAPATPPPESRAPELVLPRRSYSFSAPTPPSDDFEEQVEEEEVEHDVSPAAAILGSLRQLSLRRQRPDPWRVRAPLAPERTLAPRVLSFDAYRSRAQRAVDVPRRAPRAAARGRLAFQDGECMRLSMCGDEYVGFMGITPTRGELFRLKSRNFFARLVGRRFAQ